MGRSGGSGGMHSSGGRSGGSGFSSGSNRTSSSSHSSPSTPPSYDRRPNFREHRPPPPRCNSRSYRRTYHTGTQNLGCSIVSLITSLLGLFVIVGLVFALQGFVSCVSCLSSGSNNQHTQSNYQEYSEPNFKTEKGEFFEDNLEMDLNTATFERNMKKYKDTTGITPFVYTCQSFNSGTEPINAELKSLYKRLGLSNAVMLVYQEKNNTYGVWVYIDDAVTVEQFPDKNIDIMTDYVISNYEGNMSNAQLLSGAFLATLN